MCETNGLNNQPYEAVKTKTILTKRTNDATCVRVLNLLPSGTRAFTFPCTVYFATIWMQGSQWTPLLAIWMCLVSLLMRNYSNFICQNLESATFLFEYSGVKKLSSPYLCLPSFPARGAAPPLRPAPTPASHPIVNTPIDLSERGLGAQAEDGHLGAEQQRWSDASKTLSSFYIYNGLHV